MRSWGWAKRLTCGILMAVMTAAVILPTIANVYMLIADVDLSNFDASIATSNEVKVVDGVKKVTELLNYKVAIVITALLVLMVYNSLTLTLKVMYRTLYIVAIACLVVAFDISTGSNALIVGKLKDVVWSEQVSKVISITEIDICLIASTIMSMIVAMSIRIRANRMSGKYR